MRPYRAAIVATLLGLAAVAALVLVTTCGSSDKASPTERPTSTAVGPTASPTIKPTTDVQLLPYFQQLDAVFQKASDDSFTANDELSRALTDAQDIDQTKAAYDAFLTATESVFDAAITSMNGLDVPAAAKVDHDAFITAATSSKTLAAQLRDDLAGVTTEDELQALLNNFGTDKGPLLAAADTACNNLQETAASHGVDVDLACTGG